MLKYSIMAVASLIVLGSGRVSAQRISIDSVTTTDTLLRHEVVTRDGSRFVGRITVVSRDSIRMQLTSNVVSVARSDVKEIHQFSASKLHKGEYWPENPSATRLLFSATAYPLQRGDRYYWTGWFLLHGLGFGVTDRLSLGGGISLIPGVSVHENLVFFTPKLTLTRGDGPQAAIGAFAGSLPGLGDANESESLGFLYAVGSFGSREKNVTAGLGWGYAGSRLADQPVVTLSGVYRIARRGALISENWFVPTEEGYDGIVSAGIRFLGDKVSFDVAYINRVGDPIFPGAPWLGLTFKF